MYMSDNDTLLQKNKTFDRIMLFDGFKDSVVVPALRWALPRPHRRGCHLALDFKLFQILQIGKKERVRLLTLTGTCPSVWSICASPEAFPQ